ncbi:hypothetical protein PVAP13_8NG282400 [Panicum virgatum]|uniref:Uncharacterized protein n=1 Tax=Panicum virgatum TaxID=38727 RepID=A0A8T0PHM7_PANVG|nr:hypothetical protein PVAP13_8NG282400 [Panicum virgatum]
MAPLKRGTDNVLMLMALVVAMAMIFSSCHATSNAIETGTICVPDPYCMAAGCRIPCYTPQIAFCRSANHQLLCCCGDPSSQSPSIVMNSSRPK